MRGSSERPRLLVFNQYYWPGFEATGNLLAELCAALADGLRRHRRHGHGSDDPPTSAGRTERDGVTIVRVPSTSFDRRRLGLGRSTTSRTSPRHSRRAWARGRPTRCSA